MGYVFVYFFKENVVRRIIKKKEFKNIFFFLINILLID